jgi:glycosyltransferase involved in cell wall biosynthesis
VIRRNGLEHAHRGPGEPAGLVALLLTQDRGGPVDLTVALAREVANRPGAPRVVVVGPDPVSSAGSLDELLVKAGMRSKTDLAGRRRLLATLEGLAPDLIHAQDKRSGLLCASARLPARTLLTYHGVPDDVPPAWLLDEVTASGPGPRTRAVFAADALVARRLDAVAAPSEHIARFLRRRLKVPSTKVHVLPNGVPLPAVRPPAALIRNLVFVGGLVPAKSVSTLVTAFSMVAAARPELRLRLVGDGSDRPALETQVARLGLLDRVDFVGYRQDVPQQLAMGDCFVLPSINENQPMALIEAMAAGLPCIASRVGAVPDLLSGGAGVLVEPGNPHQLAEAIAHLSDDNALAAELGREAARRARSAHSILVCADAHLALWERLHRQAPGART